MSVKPKVTCFPSQSRQDTGPPVRLRERQGRVGRMMYVALHLLAVCPASDIKKPNLGGLQCQCAAHPDVFNLHEGCVPQRTIVGGDCRRVNHKESPTN
ncbi:hypothetical protein NHX12_007677 [Muraenolepis orangiensis]|uniref:Uncharacterized protein n=1 Tax=Muraenolepis orangiensis TaxID=630683 RepID=A0A9Q0DSV7_9TELE|nr:hypothetical protein NHX12_007677 [Muraenolepis orangiensis]